jgi:monooxygenase
MTQAQMSNPKRLRRAPSTERADVEHLDVLIVGAGLSGIGAAHHVTKQLPGATYALFETRDAIGGTWDLFRYPGVRSDSDMYTLGYPFRPWTGRKAIADGADILAYIRDTAAEDGTDRHIRFRHKVLAADWSSKDGCWKVTAERHDPNTGNTEQVELTAGFVISCSGYYRYEHGHVPDFAGLGDFEGTVVHPQHWPADLDHAGKRVVVIGSGATAVTLVPAMAPTAAHVTMLQRSPSYLVSLPAVDPLARVMQKVLPNRVSGPMIKWYKALTTQAMYALSLRRPEQMKKALINSVRRRLPDGYDVATHFTPNYDPWDQRLCLIPRGDLLGVIRDGSASVVTDHVETFTPTGIRLKSGGELDADIVVTATGLDLLWLGGIELSIDGDAVKVPERLTYKGAMLDGVPNLVTVFGYTNASWTLRADLSSRFAVDLVRTMGERGLREVTAVNDDPTMDVQPLLALSSGYVARAEDRMPKAGSRAPWQMNQSYLRDVRELGPKAVLDKALHYSNPGGEPHHANRAATGHGAVAVVGPQ